MKLQATDRIQDVQDRFQALFPLLQLRFYRIAHHGGESAMRDEIKDHTLTLSAFNPNFKAGEIRLEPETTVNKVETDFASNFGLYVQVFRKAGKHWIQTIDTDDWTLQRQQEAAAETEHFFEHIRR